MSSFIMSAKKMTTQQREALKKKREKARKGKTDNRKIRQGKTNLMPYVIIGIIIIIALGVIYFVFISNDASKDIDNILPIPMDDYSIASMNSVQLEIDLLINDNDPDGDPLNITEIGDPSNGIVELVEGIAYYTPDEDFTGVDTFEYTIDDGNGGTATATTHVFITDPEGNPLAFIDTTKGMIVAELFEDIVPITAGNFIDHANSGYYNGVIFHRVVAVFMIQGGDPRGDGSGGYAAEYHEGYGNSDIQESWVIPDEFDESLSNIRGTISMANRGPDTGGSQFFINVVDNTKLDFNKDPLSSKHAVFGEVIEGMDIVDAISNVAVTGSTPNQDIIINSITIE